MIRPFKKYNPPKDGPKALLLDIECTPIRGFVWGLWDNNVALNQIDRDWYILSFAAKWLGDPKSKTMYFDLRKEKNKTNDKNILEHAWELIDEADILITHNGKGFDLPKLRARFIHHKMKPETSVKHLDTLMMSRKHFKFTSNKLEYLADHLGVKYKKEQHKDYPGFSLWVACMNGIKKAWGVLQAYNCNDLYILEDVFHQLIPYDNRLNFFIYTDEEDFHCQCGSKEFKRNGYTYTAARTYQRLVCKSCRAEYRDDSRGKRTPVAR